MHLTLQLVGLANKIHGTKMNLETLINRLEGLGIISKVMDSDGDSLSDEISETKANSMPKR